MNRLIETMKQLKIQTERLNLLWWTMGREGQELTLNELLPGARQGVRHITNDDSLNSHDTLSGRKFNSYFIVEQLSLVNYCESNK